MLVFLSLWIVLPGFFTGKKSLLFSCFRFRCSTIQGRLCRRNLARSHWHCLFFVGLQIIPADVCATGSRLCGVNERCHRYTFLSSDCLCVDGFHRNQDGTCQPTTNCFPNPCLNDGLCNGKTDKKITPKNVMLKVLKCKGECEGKNVIVRKTDKACINVSSHPSPGKPAVRSPIHRN